MRYQLGYLLAGLMAALLTGCQAGESWGVFGSSSSTITTDGGARAHAIETITRNGEPFVILVINGSSGGSSSAGGGKASGEFRRANRSPIVWRCSVTSSGRHEAVVAGHTFDLSQGALLLVDARQETPTFQQHAFDAQQVTGQTVRADLDKIAAQNPEIAAFIADCWGKKSPAAAAEAAPMADNSP